MKRAAERQLTKDHDDDEDEEVGEGFQKASNEVIAQRKIKPLPRKSMSVSTPDVTQPTSARSVFKGFGTTSSSFPPFPTATSPFNVPLKPPPFGNPTPSTPLSPMSSFGSDTSSKTATSTDTSPSIPSISSVDINSPEYQYYLNLRGLNSSFLKSVTAALDSDPFVDFTSTLETYKSFFADIKRKLDAPALTKTVSLPEKAPPPPASKPVEKPKESGPTMPAPPAKFTGFSTASSTSSATTSAPPLGSGFKPSLTAKSSADTEPSPFKFSPAAAPPTLQPSLFSKPTSSFTFKSTETKDTETKAAETKTAEPASSTNPTPQMFKFGSSGANTAFSFSPGESPGFTPTLGTPASSTAFGTSSSIAFGSSSSTASGATTSSSPFGTSTPSTVFGSSSPPKSGGFGSAPSGFGSFSPPKPLSGNIGNQLGFSFGAKAPETKPTESEGGESQGSETGQSQGTDTETPPPVLIGGPNPHDEEGEGEEDETTEHAIRIKAFVLNGKTKSWDDLGTGILRLKKHKTTDARRVLLRNSTIGKIQLNFRIYGGMSPSLDKKTIRFIGHDEAGAMQSYIVRTKTEEQAKELKGALDREIAFVKAKQTD